MKTDIFAGTNGSWSDKSTRGASDLIQHLARYSFP